MRLIALLLTIVMLVPAILVGGNLILREATGADIISTGVYSYMLTEEVDESELCPYSITQNDMHLVQGKVNQCVANMIAYKTLENKFDINFDLVGADMQNTIELNGKEVASLAQMIIMQEDLGQVQLGEDMYIDIRIKSVSFNSINANSTKVNAIMTFDITPIKEEAEAFLNGEDGPKEQSAIEIAQSAIDILPDILYVSSTFILEENGGFSFNIYHDALTINTLNQAQVETIFATIDLFSDFGRADEINVQIATSLANALIGSENERGLAYSLVPLGAKGFDFVNKNGETYFMVVK